MVINLRIYMASFHKTLVENNPVIIIFIQLKRFLVSYFTLSKKSREVNKNIFEAKIRLEKTRSVIFFHLLKKRVQIL